MGNAAKPLDFRGSAQRFSDERLRTRELAFALGGIAATLRSVIDSGEISVPVRCVLRGCLTDAQLALSTEFYESEGLILPPESEL